MATSKVAEAGPRGKTVRSDCWVKIELTASGGIDLNLTTKVEVMYGKATRKMVGEVLAKLGVENAKVEIEDAGALPFVMAARIEAVVRRLGVDVGEGFLPELEQSSQYETRRDRFRRSRLYLPGTQPKLMLNVGLHEPDGVILDLEDSVAPAEKDAARLIVRNALRTIDFKGAERMVRINQGELGFEDLNAIVPHNVHVILIPKVEDAEQVKLVDEHCKKILKAHSIDRPVLLMPIIESCLGILKAYEIAKASENIIALTIGLEDYTADLGVQRTLDGHESIWARSMVINAAKAAGLQAIDTVFSDVGDTQGLRDSIEEAKSIGFEGKGCIHPRQIAVVHEGFAPKPAELEKARKIVAAFEDAQAKGLGVVSLGTKMIDPPVVKRALHTVQLAEAMGME